MPPREIEADFPRDLCEHFRLQLEKSGFKVRYKVKHKKTHALGKEPVEPSYYVIQYFNVLHRSISARPRRMATHSDFECPDADRPGLDLLRREVENGSELMRRLSTRVMHADYADALFNDWKIHHLHLGLAVQDNGFLARTKNVLFAMVTDDTIYCIAVLPHMNERGDPQWARQELVQIVHKHWPHLLARGRAPGLLGGDTSPTDDEIRQLREAGVTTSIQMPDGTLYLPIGGGYATSRDSNDAVERAYIYLRAVRDHEEWLRANIEEVAADVLKQGKVLPDRLRFQLELDERCFYALDQDAGVRVKLASRPFV